MTLPMDREDVHKDILLVLSRAAASELLEGAEARVGKFLSLFLHVLFNLKERSPEELKTSARAWSKRDRKADPDTPGAEKVVLSVCVFSPSKVPVCCVNAPVPYRDPRSSRQFFQTSCTHTASE